jgi:hypothetical protein
VRRPQDALFTVTSGWCQNLNLRRGFHTTLERDGLVDMVSCALSSPPEASGPGTDSLPISTYQHCGEFCVKTLVTTFSRPFKDQSGAWHNCI